MATWTLTQQRDTLLAWAVSEVGSAAAQRLARKYGLTDEPADLVAMTCEPRARAIQCNGAQRLDLRNDLMRH